MIRDSSFVNLDLHFQYPSITLHLDPSAACPAFIDPHSHVPKEKKEDERLEYMLSDIPDSRLYKTKVELEYVPFIHPVDPHPDLSKKNKAKLEYVPLSYPIDSNNLLFKTRDLKWEYIPFSRPIDPGMISTSLCNTAVSIGLQMPVIFKMVTNMLCIPDLSRATAVCKAWKKTIGSIPVPETEEKYQAFLNRYIESLLIGIDKNCLERIATEIKGLFKLELEKIRIRKLDTFIKENDGEIEKNIQHSKVLELDDARRRKWFVRDRERRDLNDKLANTYNQDILKISRENGEEIEKLRKDGCRSLFTGIHSWSLDRIKAILEQFLHKKCDLFIPIQNAILAVQKVAYDMLPKYSKKVRRPLQVGRPFIKAALLYNGGAAQHASEVVSDDFELLEIATGTFGVALGLASERWKNNLELIKKAICQDGVAMLRLSSLWKDTKYLVILAASKYGRILGSIAERFRDDEDVVHIAVANDGSALEFASERLQNDETTVMLALNQNLHTAWPFVPPALRANPKILQYVFSIIRFKYNDDPYLKEKIINDLKFEKQVIKVPTIWGDHPMEKIIETSNLKNVEVVKVLVANYGRVLKDLDAAFQNYDEIVGLATDNDPMALEFAHSRLRYERREAGKPEELEGIVMKAIRKNGLALQFADPDLQDDFEFVKVAIKNDKRAVKFASPRLQKDKRIRALLKIQYFGRPL